MLFSQEQERYLLEKQKDQIVIEDLQKKLSQVVPIHFLFGVTFQLQCTNFECYVCFKLAYPNLLGKKGYVVVVVDVCFKLCMCDVFSSYIATKLIAHTITFLYIFSPSC